MFWLRRIECHPCQCEQHFLYVRAHGCTLLITEVVIYFIQGSLYSLFHAGSLSLCVLFYLEYQKWKKSLFCKELMRIMPRTGLFFLNIRVYMAAQWWLMLLFISCWVLFTICVILVLFHYIVRFVLPWVQEMKKNLFDAHAVHKFRNTLRTVISASTA